MASPHRVSCAHIQNLLLLIKVDSMSLTAFEQQICDDLRCQLVGEVLKDEPIRLEWLLHFGQHDHATLKLQVYQRIDGEPYDIGTHVLTPAHESSKAHPHLAGQLSSQQSIIVELRRELATAGFILFE